MTFKVEVETVDALRRRLAVEVPADEVQAEIEKAYAELSRAAKVRGFRPGHVPRPVLERLFGDRVRGEVFGRLIQQSYSEVIEDRQIAAVGQPEIVTEQAEPGAALRYSATVEVKPDIVVDRYAGLQVQRPLAETTDAHVDAFMERLRQSFAQLHPIIDRSHVEAGDVVTVGYEARVAGKLVSRAETREIEMGASGLPEEFERHVIGAPVGAELDFPVIYPAEPEDSELAGKTVQFHVHVRGIARKEVPALDDEFAKDHGECGTLDALRQRVRRQLEGEAEREADEAMRRALLDELAKAHDIPVPHALIERRLDGMVDEVLHEWQRRRVQPRNQSEAVAHLRGDLEPRAREQVKIALLLDAIARQEHLEVSDAEVEERVAAIASGAGSGAERVRALYQDVEVRRQLRTRVLHTRAIDRIVEQARVTTVPRAENIAEGNQNG